MASKQAFNLKSEAIQLDFADRYRGFLIDENDREIPITEAMVQKACRQWENRYWLVPKENPSLLR